MQRRVLVNIFIGIIIIFASFVPVFAETPENSPPTEDEPKLPKIIISEIQNNGEGSGVTNHEFIEIYNNDEQIVNLENWKIIYVNSSGNESILYEFLDPFLFLPQSFILGKLSTAPEDFMPNYKFDFEYDKGSSGMAATAGGLIMINHEEENIDEVYWTSSASIQEDEDIVLRLDKGLSAQRYYLDEEMFEHDLIAQRFIVEKPTPASFLEKETPHPEENESTNPSSDAPKTEEPIAKEIVKNPPIYLSEIFPNPASPQLDSNDEFIEIYNPNSKSLDIGGYLIKAKATSEYKYTVPVGTTIAAKGFYFIKSSQSPIALTNSGSTVSLIDNFGKQIDTTTYGKADYAVSWAKAGGKWQWTSAVTPGKQNVITAPVVAVKTSSTKSSSRSSSKKSSQSKTNFANNPKIIINEVFPDPKSPLTDSKDEFIELYNPNNQKLNIADYEITSGATRTYKHSIPAGTTIAPKGFYIVTSGESSLALTNSGGTVTLTDNNGKKIDSVEYAAVLPGQSWALVQGKWQWTSTPTKNAANILSAVPGVNNANSNNESGSEFAGATVAGTDDKPLVPAPQPLPGWLLALIGVGTICYAAYEYRFEARNYYYKYRAVR